MAGISGNLLRFGYGDNPIIWYMVKKCGTLPGRLIRTSTAPNFSGGIICMPMWTGLPLRVLSILQTGVKFPVFIQSRLPLKKTYTLKLVHSLCLISGDPQPISVHLNGLPAVPVRYLMPISRNSLLSICPILIITCSVLDLMIRI